MTSDSLLQQLGATAEQIAALHSTTARRVAAFLLRWEGYAETLDLLDAWNQDEMISTQDMRARALSGLGRHSDAREVMAQRLRQGYSVTAALLEADIQAADGDQVAAYGLANQLAAEFPDYHGVARFQGETALAMNRLDEAEAAFRRYAELAPSAVAPSLGLAQVALRRGDPVAAAAYAVRAYEGEGSEVAPSSEQLRALIVLFDAIPDEIRRDDARTRMAERFEQELEEMRALIADSAPAGRQTTRTPRPPRGDSSPTTRPTARPTARPARAEEALPEPPPPSVAGDSPVSADEAARLTSAARRLFGFDTLLPWQPEILAAVCRGEDVLAILPTGGGKSLCYQLPAFMDDGAAGNTLTLVVSPLIALMKDQLDNLPAALRAETIAINSSMEAGAGARAWEAIAQGRYRLVYMAPERLRQWPVLEALRARGVARLVVDEAHCVSSWGHNFRPDYLYLAQAHRDLGAPPILALTATAPARVRQDIAQQLFGRSSESNTVRRLHVIAADSFRPNLHLSAFKASNEDEKRDWLIGFCTALQGSGIVYTRTRRNCEELAGLLQGLGISADAYHAGLGDAERSRIQTGFMAGQTRILVATVAFGMGVDKPDIRFILHHGLPASLEAYYQEAGRAGRDGLPAQCVLLHAASDKATLTRLTQYDAVTKEFLRVVYREVRARLRPWNPGTVSVEEMARTLQDGSDTKVRVALSILATAGLLRRHYDAPRRVDITLARPSADPLLAAFAQAAGLAVGRPVNADYLDICAQAGADAATLERDLLAWQRAGWLRFNSSGRDALITLVTPPPADSQARVDALVDRFAVVQAQQVSEIAAYARTTRCRHGYLSAYLGGQARRRCTACDNCGAGNLPAIESVLPDGNAQRLEVLRAVREKQLGINNLSKVLAGDSTVDERHQTMSTFGVLNYRSPRAIGHLIDAMVDEGLLERHPFSDLGFTLHLTANGARLLRDTL